MYSITQSRRIRGSGGERLPKVYDAFEDRGIIFRRGQFVLVAAGPGTGKSSLVLDYALKAGVPSLVVSADSGPFTQVARAYAMLTGEPVQEGMTYALGGEVPERIQEMEDKLRGHPIRFTYDANPSLADLDRSMHAYEELFGVYPHLTIIDNITNIKSGLQDNDSDPFSGLEGFLEFGHDMARKTESCVVGLHHVNGPYNDGDTPIPLSGVKGQIGRIPEMILTLFTTPGNQLGISKVKHREGEAKASGEEYAVLDFDKATMRISDPEPWVQSQTAPQGPIEDQRRRIENEVSPW